MGKKKDRIVYSISVADIQEVADEELERKLTLEEVKWVENRVGDYISWYDAIALAINEMIAKQNAGNDLTSSSD
jgi:hypothetical protein